MPSAAIEVGAGKVPDEAQKEVEGLCAVVREEIRSYLAAVPRALESHVGKFVAPVNALLRNPEVCHKGTS